MSDPRWLRVRRQMRRESERNPRRLTLGVDAGICGDQALTIGHGEPMWCHLMAGHIGAHSNGESHWQRVGTA